MLTYINTICNIDTKLNKQVSTMKTIFFDYYGAWLARKAHKAEGVIYNIKPSKAGWRLELAQ